jgi:hypothetical protein
MLDKKASDEILRGLFLSRDSLRRVNTRFATYRQDPNFAGSELQRRLISAMRELDACILLSERQAREQARNERTAKRESLEKE